MTSIKQRARRAAGNLVRRAGYDIVLEPLSTNTNAVLRRTLKLAGPIGTVIDIGASNGMWSKELFPDLPTADFLLFEANETYHDELRQLEATNSRVKVEYVAASDHDGEIFFRLDPDNPLGGGASAVADAGHAASLPCTSPDIAVERRNLEGPYLLKLDTQGHEMEIFEGSEKVLANAALVVVEVYGLGNPGQPPFDEICNALRARGFRAAGIADVMVRPRDGMFYQADMHFLPDTHPAFADSRYTS
jgi:FkbM family methyltransferase